MSAADPQQIGATDEESSRPKSETLISSASVAPVDPAAAPPESSAAVAFPPARSFSLAAANHDSAPGRTASPAHLTTSSPFAPDGPAALIAHECISQARQIVSAMQTAPGLAEGLGVMVDALVQVYGFRSAGVFGFPRSSPRTDLMASCSLSSEEHEIGAWWTAAAAKRMARLRPGRPAPRWAQAPNLLPHHDDAMMLPLTAGSRLLGVIALFDPQAERRLAEEYDFLSLLMIVAGLYVEQAYSEMQAQSSRNARLEQLETLVQSGNTIASSLEIDQVSENILALIRRLLNARAGWIMLHRPEDDTLRIASYSGLGRERLSHVSLRPFEGVAGQVFRTRRSWFVNDVQKESSFVYRDVAARAGLRTMLAVPLLVRSEAIGVLGVFLSEAPQDERERTAVLEIAEIFATQAAAAIQNARLYQQLDQAYRRERRIAETFQHVLLSDVPPDLPGLEVGHTYRAALDESVVGGDFYDVFPLPDSRVAMVIGDVSGKGLHAAVQTARVKFGLRAFAMDDPTPTCVIERVHQALVQQGGYEGFVTLFYGVFDLHRRLLEYANAGHEPPLLHHANGGEDWLTRTGTVIGLDLPNTIEFGSASREIASGDQLVLYTDGVTEARRDGKFLGRAGLYSSWSRLARFPAKQSANDLFEAVGRYSRGQIRDDIAILVVRFLPDVTLPLP